MKTTNLKLSLFAIGALLMSSCTNEETPNMPIVNDNSISFSSYVGRDISRAGSTTSGNLSNFGVTAFLNNGSGYLPGLTPDFMYNQLVEKAGTYWIYNPIKYWPSDASKKVSFFAYSPYVASPSAAVNNASAITAMSSNASKGDPTITFEVGTDVSKHIDLIYAKAINKTNADGKVNFEFKHALSRVGFKAVGWEPGVGDSFDTRTTITINAIKFATYRKTATFNLNTSTWSNAVDAADLRAFTLSTNNGLIQNNVINAGDTSKKQLNRDGDYMMVFPDLSGSDQYVLFVDYTIETIDESLDGGKITVRNNVYRRITPGFEAGKSYNIVVHLGMNSKNVEDDGDADGAVPVDPDPDPENPVPPTRPVQNTYISFSATVSDWNNVSNELNLPLSK